MSLVKRTGDFMLSSFEDEPIPAAELAFKFNLTKTYIASMLRLLVTEGKLKAYHAKSRLSVGGGQTWYVRGDLDDGAWAKMKNNLDLPEYKNRGGDIDFSAMTPELKKMFGYKE